MHQDALGKHRVDREEFWDFKVFAVEALSALGVEFLVCAAEGKLPGGLVGGELHDAGEEDGDDAGSVLVAGREDERKCGEREGG